MLQPIELEEPFTADKVELSEPFSAASLAPQPSKPKRRKRDIGTYYNLAAENEEIRSGGEDMCSAEGDTSSARSPSDVDDLDNNITIPEIEIGANVLPNDHPSSSINDDAPFLYPTSTITALQAVSILISWFSAFPGMSKRSFSRLLQILHFLLPKGNILPMSYNEAISLLNPYLNKVKEYHCCVNDCILYRDTENRQYKSLRTCPVCGEDRYKPDSVVPRKIFKYYSITDRINRMYGNSYTSQLLQSHGKNTTPTNSIHDSKAWKDLYAISGTFHGECRSLAFALCLDGVNPFAKEKVSYSMCPMPLVPLNLSVTSQSIMLTGIIPGPSEVKNTDPYIDVLIDEMLQINNAEVYDAYRNEFFTLEVTILLNILDYPGHNKVFHCQGAGAYAGCAYCTAIGEYSSALGKMVYLKHRSFLSADDELCSVHSGYPNRKEKLEHPEMKTTKYVDSANAKYEAASTNAERLVITRETGCKGSYALRRLPTHDRLMCTPVEPMHVLKNVSEHLVSLMIGRSDSPKVRMEEKLRNRFRSSWVGDNHAARLPLPPAPFRLTKEEIKLANERCVNIKVPSWVDWRHRRLFRNAMYLKSVEWKHVLISGILKFCIRGCLGKKQRSTVFELCDVLSDLCSRSVNVMEVDGLEYRLNRVLALLERDYPVSLHVIMFHLLHHLPMFIRQYGPVCNFWMFPTERYNSWISHRVTNRRYPESTVMETYRLFDLASFLQLSNQLPPNSSCDIETDDISDEEDPGSNKVCSDFLTESQLGSLDHYYQTNVLEYRTLMIRYRQEEAVAEREGCDNFPDVTMWAPIFGQTLTESEKCLCKGPSKQMNKCKTITVKHRNGRSVKFSSEESDNPNSSFSSSYVCIRPETATADVLFGRITFLFEHTFSNTISSFAYVHWFDGYSVDADSGLRVVNVHSLSKAISPVVTVQQLSQPLIHAVDPENSNKVWIINYHQSIL